MGLSPSSTVIAPDPSGNDVPSPIVGQVRPVKVGHSWTVSGIRELCARAKPGESVVSPIFFAGVKRCHRWRLVLYPCGSQAEYADHASLYLQLVSDDSATAARSAVTTSIAWSIIGNAGLEVNRMTPAGQYHFVNEKTLWGFGKFISHAELLSRPADNPYLSGNPLNPRLTLFCNHMNCEPTNKTLTADCNLAQIHAAESVRKLSTDLGALLRNSDLSDVTIVTATRQFPAHKVILSARSPVLAATFAHEMREKAENVLIVEDVRADIMAELLQFVYTGRVRDLRGNVMELLVSAEKYALDDLKSMCEEVLFDSLAIDNCLDLLVFADMHNATRLKARITEYVIEYSKEVAESESFERAVSSHSQLIAEVFQKMALKK